MLVRTVALAQWLFVFCRRRGWLFIVVAHTFGAPKRIHEASTGTPHFIEHIQTDLPQAEVQNPRGLAVLTTPGADDGGGCGKEVVVPKQASAQAGGATIEGLSVGGRESASGSQ